MPVNVRCTHFPILFAVVSKNSYAFLLPHVCLYLGLWWEAHQLQWCNDAFWLTKIEWSKASNQSIYAMVWFCFNKKEHCNWALISRNKRYNLIEFSCCQNCMKWDSWKVFSLAKDWLGLERCFAAEKRSLFCLDMMRGRHYTSVVGKQL